MLGNNQHEVVWTISEFLTACEFICHHSSLGLEGMRIYVTSSEEDDWCDDGETGIPTEFVGMNVNSVQTISVL
jgi:hypothetical protein